MDLSTLTPEKLKDMTLAELRKNWRRVRVRKSNRTEERRTYTKNHRKERRKRKV